MGARGEDWRVCGQGASFSLYIANDAAVGYYRPLDKTTTQSTPARFGTLLSFRASSSLPSATQPSANARDTAHPASLASTLHRRARAQKSCS